MKRVVAACVLLLSAVGVTVWTDFVFEREMNMFEKELNSLVEISESASEKELLRNAETIAFQWNI